LEEREEMGEYFGILISRVAVWWKCPVDPSTRADRLWAIRPELQSFIWVHKENAIYFTKTLVPLKAKVYSNTLPFSRFEGIRKCMLNASMSADIALTKRLQAFDSE